MSAAPQMVGSPGTPLARAQEARGYSSAYHLMREIARTQAHLMALDDWMQLQKIMSYVGFRFNHLTLSGTQFAPKPWQGRPESML